MANKLKVGAAALTLAAALGVTAQPTDQPFERRPPRGTRGDMRENPEPDHPARQVSVASKRRVRARLTELASQMGARDPEALGDGLLLLLEGACASSQVLGAEGPVRHLADAAARLIDASLK